MVTSPLRGIANLARPFTVSSQFLLFLGAGSGIRTHEGVTPNGCHFISPIYALSGSQGRRFNHSAIPARSRIQVKETLHSELT
jgi:hypothetical protein